MIGSDEQFAREPQRGPNVQLDLRTVYLKDLSLFGCTILEPNVFSHLVRYIEQGEIKPVVSSIRRLSDILLAQQEFLEKRHVGKIVLVPTPEGVVRSRYCYRDGTAPCERRVGVQTGDSTVQIDFHIG